MDSAPTQADHKRAFLLADMFISHMFPQEFINWCPESYGKRLTDEHKVLVWNDLVDIFLTMPPEDTVSLQRRLDRTYVKNMLSAMQMVADISGSSVNHDTLKLA